MDINPTHTDSEAPTEISGSPSPQDQRWVEYQFGKHLVPVGEKDPDPTRYAHQRPYSDAEIEALMNQEPIPEGWTEFSEHETAFQRVKRQMDEQI